MPSYGFHNLQHIRESSSHFQTLKYKWTIIYNDKTKIYSIVENIPGKEGKTQSNVFLFEDFDAIKNGPGKSIFC